MPREMERDGLSTDSSPEGRDPSPDPVPDPGPDPSPDGGLRELVLKWFLETQAAALVQNGQFPDWFQGFTTRKDAEEQLKDKAVGVFLLRLSAKTLGFVLSYRGEERCRHFVISPSPEGQLCITGDEQQFNSVSELIQHYKICPIQPFGEYLTHEEEQREQEDSSDLYDAVNVHSANTTGQSGVSVRALRSLWDQKRALSTETPPQTKTRQQLSHNNSNNNSTEEEPELPPKSYRRFNKSVSVETMAQTQCIANQATHPDFASTVSSPDEDPQNRPLTPDSSTQRRGDVPPTSPWSTPTQAEGGTGAQVTENQIASFPGLDQNEDSTRPPTPTRPVKKVSCLTYTYLPGSKKELKSNPLYKEAEVQQPGVQYTELKHRGKNVEPTYENIDRKKERRKEKGSHVYEGMGEKKTKEDRPKNKERKNFFADRFKK